MPPALLMTGDPVHRDDLQSLLLAHPRRQRNFVLKSRAARGGADRAVAQLDVADGNRCRRASAPGDCRSHCCTWSLGLTWLSWQLAHQGFAHTIANLNTYNLLFLMLAMLLHWRPRRFVEAVSRSIPSVAGVLIQYPFLGALSAMMTTAKNADGESLALVLSNAFGTVVTSATFAPVVAIYSALLGLVIPSGGGKWLVEGPYVMQAANDLHYNLGWTVQIYNAAEALPNLINPFWMLPVLGILGLKARDLIGFTFVQFLVKLPLVLLLAVGDAGLPLRRCA
jgi:short-chain fatty acids transporter